MRRMFGIALALAMLLSMASVAFAKEAPVRVKGHIGDTRERYCIDYDANGGTGSYSGPKLLIGETDTVCSLSQTGIAREGYGFTGWNINADGSGAKYQSGDSITLNYDVTLYAQWRARATNRSKDSIVQSNSDWVPWGNGTTSPDPDDSVPPTNDGDAPESDGAATSSGNAAELNSDTGDRSNIPLYVSLLCGSLAVMLFLPWLAHRKKRLDAQKS